MAEVTAVATAGVPPRAVEEGATAEVDGASVTTTSARA